MKANKVIGVSTATATAWDLRPGGMLVQKRNSDANHNHNPLPKVKHDKSYHEIISPQASIGRTGQHAEDQKMMFKEKERDSKAFLDLSDVKDGVRIVVVEDELRRERRRVEALDAAAIDKASKEIATIRGEVDKLAKQVSNIEIQINGGNKLADKVMINMTELLMNQLIKLDGISGDGDVKLQRRMQVRRVQKYIETLDMLKIHNLGLGKIHTRRQILKGEIHELFANQHEERKQGSLQQMVRPGPTSVTAHWQTF